MERSLSHGAEIRRLPYGTPREVVEEILRGEYQRMTALVAAETSGSVPRCTEDVLQSPEYCERWVDALMQVTANTAASLAHQYLDVGVEASRTDREFQRLSRAYERYSLRLQQARTVANQAQRDISRGSSGRPWPKASDVDPAGVTLCKAREVEYLALKQEEASANGCPELFDELPEGDSQRLAWGVRNGFLREPADTEARHLLTMPLEEFLEVTVRDVQSPGGNEPKLRRADLLPRWGDALELALDDVLGRLGDGVTMRHQVPPSAWFTLPGDHGQAVHRIHQLRFTEAVLQRRHERKVLATAALSELFRALEAARHKVRERARIRLKEDFPGEYAIHSALFTH